jgi:hypothetical protein
LDHCFSSVILPWWLHTYWRRKNGHSFSSCTDCPEWNKQGQWPVSGPFPSDGEKRIGVGDNGGLKPTYLEISAYVTFAIFNTVYTVIFYNVIWMNSSCPTVWNKAWAKQNIASSYGYLG